MKQVRRLSLLLALVCAAAATSARAQTPTPTPTPDPFVAQITSTASDNFARDISGDGRFVVIESAGNLATVEPRNADGNREIFLFDYAQRRIFQITDTSHVLTNPDATGDARFAQANIAVEITNNRPMISRDGKWIAFTSNGFDPAVATSSPFLFRGDAAPAEVRARLRADGNQEIFLYRIPDVTPGVDLSAGANLPLQNLSQNAFTRVTNTPASRLPRAGTANSAPFVADDNRSVQPNDRASRLVFVSTRDLTPAGARRNADGTPEVFAYNRGDGSFVQITETSFDANPLVFAENPNISGDTTSDDSPENPTSVIAFISNANIPETGQTAGANADANAEVYVAQFNGTAVTALRQVTRTRRALPTDFINVLSPGRRLSRDGARLAFETTAADPVADNTTNQFTKALLVYNVPTNNFTQIGPRAADDETEDVLRFPTFTGDSARVVWVSTLNLTPAGARVAADDAAGLNPTRTKQIYTAALPAPTQAITSVARLTNITGQAPFDSLQPFVSNTVERISFSLAVINLGGPNPDNANEVYYLVTPPVPAAAASQSPALAFLTGATRRPVVTPTASPTPTPSPSPVTGLAPGMVGIVTTTAASQSLSDVTARICPEATPNCDAASESGRRPPLPVELGGVSLSINGAAAGLYFVSPTEIHFVVPAGLLAQTGTATYPVVINIRAGGTGAGAVRTVRAVLQIVAAQPDLYSSTNGPGGRAAVTNVTNPLLATGTTEPFRVTTTYTNASGQQVTEATLLRQVLTGVRGIARANITVRLVKVSDNSVTDITGDQIPRDPQPTDLPGVFTLDFRLPASLAGAGDVAIIVLVNSAGTSSRPADTAPRFEILPNPPAAP